VFFSEAKRMALRFTINRTSFHIQWQEAPDGQIGPDRLPQASPRAEAARLVTENLLLHFENCGREYFEV
jgi:hypothetical protein